MKRKLTRAELIERRRLELAQLERLESRRVVREEISRQSKEFKICCLIASYAKTHIRSTQDLLTGLEQIGRLSGKISTEEKNELKAHSQALLEASANWLQEFDKLMTKLAEFVLNNDDK